MLRLLVALLLLANLGWWAWSQGWLPPDLLPAPDDIAQREPGRRQLQVRPETIELLPAATASATGRAACLEAGPFAPAAWAAAASSVEGAGVADYVRLPTDDGGSLLRVPAADPTRRAALAALPPGDLAGGFRPCR